MQDNRGWSQWTREELLAGIQNERQALIRVCREATKLFQEVHNIGCELTGKNVPEGRVLVEIAADWTEGGA